MLEYTREPWNTQQLHSPVGSVNSSHSNPLPMVMESREVSSYKFIILVPALTLVAGPGMSLASNHVHND